MIPIEWLKGDFGEHGVLNCEQCLDPAGCDYVRYPLSEFIDAHTENEYVAVLRLAAKYAGA